MSAVTRLLLSIAALAGVAAFVGLGCWQLDRAQEKATRLVLGAEILRSREVQPLADALAQSMAWVGIEGEFASQPALLLDNQLRHGRAGVRAYRLFDIDTQPASLLVDLGWLPLDAQRNLPAIDRPAGRLRLEGLLLPPPAAGIALGPALQSHPPHWLMTRVDVEAIARALSLASPPPPRVLRLDPDFPLGYERDLDVLPNTLPPERHRGYALQWFALAAAVTVVYLVLSVRALRRRSLR